MKKYLAFALLSAAWMYFPAAIALQSDEAVEIPFYVDEGDKRPVRYKFTKTKSQAGKTQFATGEVEAEILITSVGDETFEAEWTTLSVSADGELIGLKNAAAQGFYIGVPITYTAQYDGAPIEISDANEIIADMLSDDGPMKELDNAVREKTTEFFRQMDSTVLAQVLLKAPAIMSICQSTNFVRGELVEYDDQVANPFGGNPFPVRVTYLLSGLSEDPNVATIEWTQTLDSEKSKDLIIQILDRFVPEESDEIGEVPELVENAFIISSKATCDIDRETGWVRTARYERNTSLGTAFANLEVYEITVD